MKLLYYIAALGEPNLNIKCNILQHNIKYIYNYLKQSIDLCINFYTTSPEIIENLKKNKYINKIFIYEKKGVLTELFLTNPHNSIIKEYDYILFILDDVKIVNINIMEMIKIKKKNNLEMISPKVIKSSHSFMNLYSTGLSINNFLEVYFLLLNPENFFKFLSLHTIENKWMWGVDLLFGYYNIKAGVYFNFTVEHVLPTRGGGGEALILSNKYIEKYTEFKSLHEIFRKYKPLQKYLKT